MRTSGETTKIGIPNGELLAPLKRLLTLAGILREDNASNSRCYRLGSMLEYVTVKVYRECDLPMLIQLRRCDLIFCRLDLVLEKASPTRACLMPFFPLDLGARKIALVVTERQSDYARYGNVINDLEEGTSTLVTDYPNLTERYLSQEGCNALMKVYPVWGNALEYLPETGRLAITTVDADSAENYEVYCLDTVLQSTCWLFGSDTASGLGVVPEIVQRIQEIKKAFR